MIVPTRCNLPAAALSACLIAWTVNLPAHALDGEQIDRLLEQGLYLEARALVDETEAAGRAEALAFYRARVAIKLGDLHAALEALAPFRGRDDLPARLHRVMGQARGLKAQRGSKLAAAGELSGIRQHFEAAVAKDPDNQSARLALVKFNLNVPGFFGGSEREARQHAEALAASDPARALAAEAIIAADDDRLDAAMERVERALERDPKLRLARSLEAEFALERGAPERALAALGTLLEEAPAHPDYNRRFAAIAAEHGLRVERGIEAARRYLEYAEARAELGLDGGNRAKGYYRLGRLCERSGDRAAALEAYRQALEIDPELDAARDALPELTPA